MVGWFVQKKNVSVLQNEAAQVHPGLFPAGETVEKLGAHFRGNGEAVGHLTHGGIGIITADALKFGRQLTIAAKGLFAAVSRRHGDGQFFHFLRQLLVSGKSGMQHVVHGEALGIHGNLGNQAHAAVFGYDHAALVRLQFSGQNPEQRGFSGAVSAQKPHPLSALHLKGDPIEYVISYFKGFFQSIYTNFYHNLTYTVSRRPAWTVGRGGCPYGKGYALSSSAIRSKRPKKWEAFSRSASPGA